MPEPARHREPPLHPLPHTVVATWPKGTFLENVAVLPDGSFALSVHNQNKLLRVERGGHSSVLAETPESPAGIVIEGEHLFVAVGEPGAGPHHIYRIDPASHEATDWVTVPGSLFLNGFTRDRSGRAFTVDSLVGAVYEIDLQNRTARMALQHESLTKCSDNPLLPGVNGVKAASGSLWMTNTDRALVLRSTLMSDGRLEEPVIVADELRGDDLAVGKDGTLYVTNHIHNTLIKLSPQGERVAIAGPEQGMAGSTACVFAHTGLYVTTTGGIILPYAGQVQEAKLVRLELKEERA